MKYEIIQHDQIKGMKLLVDEIRSRTLHMHREFELILCLEGTLQINCSGVHYVLNTGQSAMINPWQTHEFSSSGSAATCLFLQFSHENFKNFFPMSNRLRFEQVLLEASLDPQKSRMLSGMLTALGIDYFSMEPLYEIACMRQCISIFEFLLHELSWSALSSEAIKQESVISQRLERITDYVAENYTSKLLLSEIAQAENLSVSHLTHFIKQYMNMSFQTYLALVRLEHARQLLEKTDMTPTEISRSCGFSDLRYLNKIMQKQFGCSAEDYRCGKHEPSRALGLPKEATQERIYSDTEALQRIFRYIEETT